MTNIEIIINCHTPRSSKPIKTKVIEKKYLYKKKRLKKH